MVPSSAVTSPTFSRLLSEEIKLSAEIAAHVFG
jgi:hypothetical protein